MSTDSDASRKTPCIEHAVAEVLNTAIDLRFAPQACFLLVLGAQAAYWSGLSAAWWLPIVALLVTLIWAFISWQWAQTLGLIKGGISQTVATLLKTLGIRLGNPWAWLIAAISLAVVMSLPWWPAAVAWAAVSAVLIGYVRLGRSAVILGEAGITLLGLAAIGIAFLPSPYRWLQVLSATLLLRVPAVLELGMIGDAQALSLIMAFLVVSLAGFIENRNRQIDPMHMLVVVEAHCLLSAEGGGPGKKEAVPSCKPPRKSTSCWPKY